jgi:hypothetical protein
MTDHVTRFGSNPCEPVGRGPIRGRTVAGLSAILLLIGSAVACSSPEFLVEDASDVSNAPADLERSRLRPTDDLSSPATPSLPATRLILDSDPRELSWAPPRLTDPLTVVVGEDEVVDLDDDQDYRVVFPATPIRHDVVVSGGHNVVIIGGEINIPYQGPDAHTYQRRALLLRGQTGVIHIEGLLMTGEDLSEGINIDAPEAIVQLQNIRIEHIHARDQVDFSDNHPDVIQPWGGVGELRVDRLTAQTDYQGIFLKEDLGPIGPVTLRRVHIEGDPTARYLYWKQADFELTVDRSFVSPAPGRSLELTLWPDVETWSDLTVGAPPAGEFVPRSLVGIGYKPWPYADEDP